MLPVYGSLVFVGLSGRDDAHHAKQLSISMAHDQEVKTLAHAQQHEPILPLRMLGIEDESCVLVVEDGARIFERHPMFSFVRRIL